MAPTTNYAEIQQDEINALRSIYPEEFLEDEVKTGAWNRIADRGFQISLRSSEGKEPRLAVTLHVSFPPTYPKSLPRFRIHFDDNVVRRSTRTHMLAVVDRESRRLLGSEMIFDLTQALQNILDDTAEVDSKELSSLEEERLIKELAERTKAKDDERQREVEAEQANDVRRREEEKQFSALIALGKERTNERRMQRRSSVADELIPSASDPGVTLFDNISNFDRPQTLKIRAVDHKVVYRQGPIASLFTVQPWKPSSSAADEAQSSLPAPFLVLKEYAITTDVGDEKTRLAILDLEGYLEIQMKQESNPHIMRVSNYLIKQSSGVTTGKEKIDWTVSVLTRLAERGNVEDALETSVRIESKQLRTWCLQILEALHQCHQQRTPHADLHLANILLDTGDAKNVVAKLTDGGYAHKIHSILKSSSRTSNTDWTAPETLKGSITNSTDIWDFGVCLLQMAFGKDALESYRSPTALLADLRLSKALEVILRKIFNSNPKRRPTPWDLLHSDFFRSDEALLQNPFVEHEQIKGWSGDRTILGSHHFRRQSAPLSTTSRYTADFMEEGKLGRGGFGEVFKARHRTDGQPYAVKKIKAKSKVDLDPVLSEVSVLSRLNHPNVVRYFSSWIEDGIIIVEDEESSTLSRNGFSSSLSKLGFAPTLPPSSKGLDLMLSNHVEFGDPKEKVDDADESSSNSSEESESEDDTAMSQSYPVDNDLRPFQGNAGGVEFGFNLGNFEEASNQHEDTWAILYIQMEYCSPQTLRDEINLGLHTRTTDSWRLFRQILQGLSHIHAASIVHRDLKPENIFIDQNGDVRIGDFGLAKPGLIEESSRPRVGLVGHYDQTRDIGTAFYIAPEVQASGAYNQKADMYSLGIILLEMNANLTTGMERVEALKSLQDRTTDPSHILSMPEKDIQVSIIGDLIKPDPRLRPSSAALLGSSRIPLHRRDETFNLARRLIMDSESPLRKDLIESLFATESTSTVMREGHSHVLPMVQKMQLLDHINAMSEPSFDDPKLAAVVKMKLASILERYGAVERSDSPALIPHQAYYASQQCFQLLESNGDIVQLPYDLVLPHASMLARKNPRNLQRTFTFGKVYRTFAQRHMPHVYGQMTFDLVSDRSDQIVFNDAEAIKALDDILDAFPNLSSAQMCFHLNHSRLLNAILHCCNVDDSKGRVVKETLSNLNEPEWAWTRVRHELRAPPISITNVSLDALEQFDFRESLSKAIVRIKSLLPQHQGLQDVFAHLESVVRHLHRLGMKRNVYLAPLSNYNEIFYSNGLLFQCLYDQKKRKVFAAGGRYDQLVREHQPLPTIDNIVHVVGFELTWSGLTIALMNFLKAQAKSKSKRRNQEGGKAPWTSRRCEVRIDAVDEDVLMSGGLDALKDLRASNISAEIGGHDATAHQSHVQTDDSTRTYGWIVLLKSEDQCKVRNLARKDEIDVRLTELATHISSDIRDRDREEVRERVPKSNLLRHSSQADAHVAGLETEPDFKVLTPKHRNKKINRKSLVEDAQARAQSLRSASEYYPFVAVDVKDSVFNTLERTSLQEPESWKRVIQDAAFGEREYLSDLQKLLTTYADRPAVFLYNFRTKQICVYRLSRGDSVFS